MPQGVGLEFVWKKHVTVFLTGRFYKGSGVKTAAFLFEGAPEMGSVAARFVSYSEVCMLIRQIVLCCVLSATGWVLPVLGQNTESMPVKRGALADYARILLKENPSIAAARARWQSELQRVSVVRGLPDPAVHLGYFLENIETAVGPQEYKIGLRQMIPWPGKLIVQGQIQSERARAAYFQLQTEIQAQMLALTRLYYEAYFLERSIAVTRQHLEWVRQWSTVSLNRYRSAQAGHMQVAKAQIEAIKLEDDLATLERQRKPMQKVFAALINRLEFSRIVLPDSLEFIAETLDRELFLEKVMRNNPDLARLQAVSQVAAKGLGLTRLNVLPDLGVGVDRIFTGQKIIDGQPVFESGKDPWVLSVSISLPLWFGRQRAAMASVRQRVAAANFNRQSRENRLRSEFESTWFQWEDAVRKVALYRHQLMPKARESMKVSAAAYAVGDADFLDLVDAQRRLLEFTLVYEHALAGYYQYRAVLAALAGAIE